jgi:oligopeptide/dipeptide ABC transporter ATP-binding protein
MTADVLLRADDLMRSFPVRGLAWHRRRPVIRALNGVSLSVARKETLAVVGESGCGKSTLARALVRLIELDSGQIRFAGENVRTLRGDALRRYNRRVQLVFQDPFGSLNPRMTVGEMLEEALRVHRIVAPSRRTTRIAELLSLVRLPSGVIDRFPHEFSGGQRQRIAIARALSVQPDVLIADEIVSALDVSVQAQILNLLLDLQRDLGLAILFVSHDLRVVRHLAHRVAVMYLGRVVEVGDTDAIFASPLHPYTQALLRAVPQMRVGRRNEEVALAGELPSALAIPSGCPFHPRCPLVLAHCRVQAPLPYAGPGDHKAECHLMDQRRQSEERTAAPPSPPTAGETW